MFCHIKSTRRKSTTAWSGLIKLTGSIILLLLLVSSSEAIVKQTSVSASGAQVQAQSSPSQQSRSDEAQQSAPSSQQQQQQQQQSVYNNHQAPSAISSAGQQQQQAQQPSYSSSVSVSSSQSSSNSPGSGPQQSAGAGAQPQNGGLGGQYNGPSGYNMNPSSAIGQKQSNYLDIAASNPEQSYTSAAHNVNMALANSGIYNGAASGPSYANQPSQQQQPSSGSGPQNLNPLHYFYYPPKDSVAAAPQPKVAGGSSSSASGSGMDMMPTASNNYQSLSYPSYADQLGNAFSSLQGAGPAPDASASNQEPSYLPQPSNNGDIFGNANNGPMNGNGNGQMYPGNQDLNSYASNLNPSQNVPSMSQQQPAQQSQHNSPSVGGGISFPSSSGSSNSNDYLSNSQSIQGNQPSGYQSGSSGLYNQIGDLSTSNFGNNPGGLNSVASYMSPSSPHQGQQQSQPSQHQQNDLFGSNSPLFGQSASNLSPSAVSPPVGGQQQAGNSGASALFGSSLFGNQAGQAAAGNGGLFSSQNFLNSYLSPQQYTQLTGQQMPAEMMQQSASAMQAQQQPQQQSQIVPAASSAVSSSGSSKRFGISSFIMPMLALAGLSLLIPTMSNIGTAVGRKKRSVEDRASAGNRGQSIVYDSINGINQLAKEHSIGEYIDKIERYYSIYKNAVESDDCMNRLICEFGEAVKDVSGKSAIVTVIERLVPQWMVGKVHLFKEAALESKEGKEKCKKYVCHSGKRVS